MVSKAGNCGKARNFNEICQKLFYELASTCNIIFHFLLIFTLYSVRITPTPSQSTSKYKQKSQKFIQEPNNTEESQAIQHRAEATLSDEENDVTEVTSDVILESSEEVLPLGKGGIYADRHRYNTYNRNSKHNKQFPELGITPYSNYDNAIIRYEHDNRDTQVKSTKSKTSRRSQNPNMAATATQIKPNLIPIVSITSVTPSCYNRSPDKSPFRSPSPIEFVQPTDPPHIYEPDCNYVINAGDGRNIAQDKRELNKSRQNSRSRAVSVSSALSDNDFALNELRKHNPADISESRRHSRSRSRRNSACSFDGRISPCDPKPFRSSGVFNTGKAIEFGKPPTMPPPHPSRMAAKTPIGDKIKMFEVKREKEEREARKSMVRIAPTKGMINSEKPKRGAVQAKTQKFTSQSSHQLSDTGTTGSTSGINTGSDGSSIKPSQLAKTGKEPVIIMPKSYKQIYKEEQSKENDNENELNQPRNSTLPKTPMKQPTYSTNQDYNPDTTYNPEADDFTYQPGQVKKSTSNYSMFAAKKSQVQSIRDEMQLDRVKDSEYRKSRVSAVKPAGHGSQSIMKKQESGGFVRVG